MFFPCQIDGSLIVPLTLSNDPSLQPVSLFINGPAVVLYRE